MRNIAKLVSFASLSLASSYALSEEVDLKAFCSNDMRIEKLHDVISTLGPLAGKERVPCLLDGEKIRVCKACSNKVSDAQIAVIKKMMADEGHRKWHREWHAIRQWVGPTDGLQQVLQSSCPKLKAGDNSYLTMTNDRPPSNVPESMDMDSRAITNEFYKKKFKTREELLKFEEDHNAFTGRLAGEDFLFMHREMTKMVQTALTVEKQECIAGWADIPSTKDKEWPTPLNNKQPTQYETGPGRSPKARDEASQAGAKAFLKNLRSPEYLRSVSLSQFGSCIEHTVHAFMHIKYADANLRCKDLNDTSEKCDDLLPSHSAHLNKNFWKIHGLVDNLIGDWLKANNKETIAKDCTGIEKCVEWSKDLWIGDNPPLKIK